MIKEYEHLLYSISQLESDLENRVKDLVNKGASKESATKIAWDEFPKKDKEALNKLYTELKNIL
jgi:hypothetical protein